MQFCNTTECEKYYCTPGHTVTHFSKKRMMNCGTGQHVNSGVLNDWKKY